VWAPSYTHMVHGGAHTRESGGPGLSFAPCQRRS
jgi:hypothetical protein